VSASFSTQMTKHTIMATYRPAPVLLALILCARLSPGQTAPGPSATTLGAPVGTSLVMTQLPPDLQTAAKALGDRLTSPGKERLVIVGTLTQSGVTVPATITYQLPNSVRIDLAAASPRSLTFDGTKSSATAETDSDMMESLLDDSPEVMLDSLAHGMRLRTLAYRARLDDGTTRNYGGPWAAIYQLVGGVPSRANLVLRQKHFYFDSQTHLPTSVRYQIKRTDGSIVAVETARSAWTSAVGEFFPGTITRTENGAIVFVFHSTSATVGSAATDGIFVSP
jgi:hypothetical protein